MNEPSPASLRSPKVIRLGNSLPGPRRFRFCTWSAVLAAAFFSAVVVIPFLPAFRAQAALFTLETQIVSSVETAFRIYYDVGRGYNEADATQAALPRSTAPTLLRLKLPPATYRSLRIDPIDRAGTATFTAPLQIVSEGGRVAHTIPFSAIHPLHQIASHTENDARLTLLTTADADDPQVEVTFTPPLRLNSLTQDHLAGGFWRALGVFATLVVLLIAADRLPALSRAATTAANWLRARPHRAVLTVAALAVLASAYPVVFLGQSHVSPNFGTAVLYDYFPSLPGDKSSEVMPHNGSDFGPALWQEVPYAFVQRRALAQGELPLWNRSTLTGAPLLAQGQSMFGDPLHGIVLLFGGTAWAWDLKFLLAKWLLAAGLGLTVLAILGPRPSPVASSVAQLAPLNAQLLPALLIAFAAPLIGFFHYRINHPAVFTLSYAPWVLLAWMRLAAAADRRAIAGWCSGLWIANLALLNSGTAKESALLLLQMNLAGAGILLVHHTSWRARGMRFAAAAWTGGILLMVTMPAWFTFLTTLPHAFTASAVPGADQIQPALLLGIFDELFYRPLSATQRVFNPSANFVVLLGLLYFLVTLREQATRPAVLVCAVAAAIALAFVFGVVPASWIAQLPLLGQVGHIDNCFSCGFIILASVLAGVGFASATERLRTSAGRCDLLIAGLLMVTIVGAWLGFSQSAHRVLPGDGSTVSNWKAGEALPIPPSVWGSLIALMLASIVLAVIARRSFVRNQFTTAGALLAALSLLVLLWRHGLHAPAVGFERYVVRPPARPTFSAPSPAIGFLQAAQRQEPGRLFGLHGNLTPGWNAVYGLEAIHGPDALQPRGLRELLNAAPVTWGSTWRLYLASGDVARSRPFLDALNVRYYVDLATNPPPNDPSLTLAHRADLDVYASPTVWPRAFFTSRVETYRDPADLVQKILANPGRPLAAMAATDAALLPMPGGIESTPSPVVPATDYQLTENTTAFTINAAAPGLAVLHEAWWPDSFRVDVDGRRVPIVRVNHAFKGVRIDTPGVHRVTFSYWPRNFTRSLIVAAIGAGLGLLSLALALRPRRRA